MGYFSDMISLQTTLFSLMIVGFISTKIGIITESGRKTLSNLLINVILPCNILLSFLSGANIPQDFTHAVLLLVLISAAIQCSVLFLSKPVFCCFPEEHRKILTYGMLCSNSSFIGYPFAEAIYGSIGIIYTSIFQIPIRLTMWSIGPALFTKVDRNNIVKKLLLHPCIVSVFAGLCMMVLQVQLPKILNDTIISISKCTTPVSMFVVGSILTAASFRSLFSKPVLFYALLRLCVLPALLYGILLSFKLDPTIIGITLLMSGMPAGSTASILADKYGGDAKFASQITFTSTLCSIITIPLLTLLIS